MHFSLRSSNQQDLKIKFGEHHCYFAASQMAKGTPSAVNDTNAGMLLTKNIKLCNTSRRYITNYIIKKIQKQITMTHARRQDKSTNHQYTNKIYTLKQILILLRKITAEHLHFHLNTSHDNSVFVYDM